MLEEKTRDEMFEINKAKVEELILEEGEDMREYRRIEAQERSRKNRESPEISFLRHLALSALCLLGLAFVGFLIGSAVKLFLM